MACLLILLVFIFYTSYILYVHGENVNFNSINKNNSQHLKYKLNVHNPIDHRLIKQLTIVEQDIERFILTTPKTIPSSSSSSDLLKTTNIFIKTSNTNDDQQLTNNNININNDVYYYDLDYYSDVYYYDDDGVGGVANNGLVIDNDYNFDSDRKNKTINSKNNTSINEIQTINLSTQNNTYKYNNTTTNNTDFDDNVNNIDDNFTRISTDNLDNNNYYDDNDYYYDNIIPIDTTTKSSILSTTAKVLPKSKNDIRKVLIVNDKFRKYDQRYFNDCPIHLDRNLCLNDGKCFKIIIYNNVLVYGCKCIDNSYGFRCEFKSIT